MKICFFVTLYLDNGLTNQNVAESPRIQRNQGPGVPKTAEGTGGKEYEAEDQGTGKKAPAAEKAGEHEEKDAIDAQGEPELYAGNRVGGQVGKGHEQYAFGL